MDELIYAGSKAMQLVLLLSIFPVAVATIVGLVIGLFQTVTQIQEQTLPFGIKLVAVMLCMYLTAGWTGEHLMNYAHEMVDIATAVKH